MQMFTEFLLNLLIHYASQLNQGISQVSVG